MMDLQAMVGKSPDADFLRDMIGFAAKRLMELEVGGLTGAAYGEKDVERLAQRNGYPPAGKAEYPPKYPQMQIAVLGSGGIRWDGNWACDSGQATESGQ